MTRPIAAVPLAAASDEDESGLASLGFGKIHYAKPAYFKRLLDAGILPLGVCALSDDDALALVSQKCDGLMLIGGYDIDPSIYGRPNEGSVKIVKIRDEAELKILRLFVEAKKPVFGICRGAQIMAAAFGAALTQDLPSAGFLGHGKRGAEYGEHEVVFEPGSLLARAAGTARAIVNSSHHQAVEAGGGKLFISARASDGVAEAVEAAASFDAPEFFLGVQWHPEDMDSELSTRLFAAFAEACAKSKIRVPN